VPILQAIDSFIIFGILLLIERYYKDRPVGFVLAATMALWGLTRFYEERLWLGEIGHLGSVLVQIAGLALFVAGVAVMAVLHRRHRDGAPPPDPDATAHDVLTSAGAGPGAGPGAGDSAELVPPPV
jgi:prolipoprotein diacylglyceryltransferase